ncbi:hypothetical protein HYW21_08170 [Candidatus Woesearchaeota archaeon]|nr:hypothetical protein [Candidatus Woesearchaeota archaeon]
MRRVMTFDTGEMTYHLEITSAHPSILTAGNPGRIRKIARYLDSPELIESDRGLTVHGRYRSLPITAFSTGMGPASVSITMPEVIEACDADSMVILRLGTAGGLQPYLNIGDFVITTTVQRAESTSDKIMGPGYEAVASQDLTDTLLTVARSVKADFQQVYAGKTRVTDDIYWDARASKTRDPDGALAVSMEASVIFALRDWYNQHDGRNIRAGELLVISDNVMASTPHVDGTEFLKRKETVEDAQIRVGLETLLRLYTARVNC